MVILDSLWRLAGLENATPWDKGIWTRRETLDVTQEFLPNIPPVAVEGLGFQVGGWYYALWTNPGGEKLACRFNRADTDRKAYFVARWGPDQSPSRQEIVDMIDAHAQGLRRANLQQGVVLKRGFVRDVVHIWAASGFDINFDVKGRQLFASYATHDLARHTPVSRSRPGLLPKNWEGFPISLDADSNVPLERLAEKTAMDLFYLHITSSLAGRKELHVDVNHPHRRMAQVHSVSHQLLQRRKRALRTGAGVDAFEEGLEIYISGFTLAGSLKSLVGIGTDIYKMATGKPLTTSPFAGAPDLTDPFVKSIIEPSKYILPLGHFFHAVDPKFLAGGHWLGQQDFGNPGIAPVYRHKFKSAADAELLLLAEPMIGSQIRFYRFHTIRSKKLTDNVYAMRVFRPDGYVVTLTRAEKDRPSHFYVHYEDWRNAQADKTPLFSSGFIDKLRGPKGFAIYATDNLLLGVEPWRDRQSGQIHSAFNPADGKELNGEFERHTGSQFVRPVGHFPAEASPG